MKKVADWFKINILSLNYKKTNYIIFHQRNKMIPNENLDIKIDGVNIARVMSTKFLGVIIDEQMTWKNHITYIASKLSKMMGIFVKI